MYSLPSFYIPPYIMNQLTKGILPSVHFNNSNTTDNLIHSFNPPISHSSCFKPIYIDMYFNKNWDLGPPYLNLEYSIENAITIGIDNNITSVTIELH